MEHDADLSRDLDEYVVGIEPTPDDWTGDPDAVEPARDPDEATRILRRLYRLDLEQQRIDRLAQQEIDRITAWREDRLAGVVRDRSWNEQRLEGWARANYSRTDKGKTWKMPNGEVVLRKAQPKIQVEVEGLEPLTFDLDDERIPEAVRAIGEVVPGAISFVPKISGSTLKGELEPAPVADSPPDADGYARHVAIDAATSEVVPGVFFLVPTRLAFTAKPSTAAAPMPYDEAWQDAP